MRNNLPQYSHQHTADQSIYNRDLGRAFKEINVALVDKMPRADAKHKKASCGDARKEHVRELHPDMWIGEQRQEICHLSAAISKDKAHWLLHERVGDQNPQRGKIRANRHCPHHRRVRFLGQLIPAENPQAQESGFEEKGEQRLDGKRRAKNVAHKARVFRPIHAELKFLHDAGDDADRKIDEEQLAPEFGQAQVHLIPVADVGRFQDRHEDGQAQRQGHEKEMVYGCDGKLQARQKQSIHKRAS